MILRTDSEMIAYDIYLTEQAEENYKNICLYLENNIKSEKAKSNFVNAFDAQMLRLSKSPEICQMCAYPPLTMRRIRYILIHQYKAYYKIDEQNRRVNILFIRHCLQDETKLKS